MPSSGSAATSRLPSQDRPPVAQYLIVVRLEPGITPTAPRQDPLAPGQVLAPSLQTPFHRGPMRHVLHVRNLVAELDQFGPSRAPCRMLHLELLPHRLWQPFVIRYLTDQASDSTAEERLEFFGRGLRVLNRIVQHRGHQDRQIRDAAFRREDGRDSMG